MAALFLSDEAWADWMAETLGHLSQDQADAMLDVVKANGDTIQQAWEENEEEQ